MLYGGRVEKGTISLFIFILFKKKGKKKKRFFSFLFETVHTIDLIASDRRRRTMPTPRIIYRFFFISLPGRSFFFVLFFLFLRTNGTDLYYTVRQPLREFFSF